jgi:hypothetical protein
MGQISGAKAYHGRCILVFAKWWPAHNDILSQRLKSDPLRLRLYFDLRSFECRADGAVPQKSLESGALSDNDTSSFQLLPIILRIAAISTVDVSLRRAGGISGKSCLNDGKWMCLLVFLQIIFQNINFLSKIFLDWQKRLRQSASIPAPCFGVLLD